MRGIALIFALVLAVSAQAQVVVDRHEIHTAKQCIYYDCPDCNFCWSGCDSCETKRDGDAVWVGPKCLCLDQTRYYVERIDADTVGVPCGCDSCLLYCFKIEADTVWVNYPLIIGSQKFKWIKGKAEVDWPWVTKGDGQLWQIHYDIYDSVPATQGYIIDSIYMDSIGNYVH